MGKLVGQNDVNWGQAGKLVLTSYDQLLFIFKIKFIYVTNQATIMRRSLVLSLPFQLMFPDYTHNHVASLCRYQAIHFFFVTATPDK